MTVDEARAEIRSRILRKYGALFGNLKAHFGEDYRESREPEAIALREKRSLSNFLAFSFDPWPMWQLHVGVVPLNSREISVGIHVGQASYTIFRSELEELAHALKTTVRQVDAVSEVQCNLASMSIDTHGVEEIYGNVALLCCYCAAMTGRSIARAGER